MKNELTRRSALKLAAAGIATTAIGCQSTMPTVATTGTNNQRKILETKINDPWSNTHDRVWIGGEYWANPMENWRVHNGAVECQSTGGNRSIHSLVHQLVDASGEFNISVNVSRLEYGENDGGAAIRIGVKSDLNEYRSNCFVQKGYDAGFVKNQLVLGQKTLNLPNLNWQDEVQLTLIGKPRVGVYEVELQARLAKTQQLIGRLNEHVASDKILGNVAIVSNFKSSSEKMSIPGSSRYRFSDWTIAGSAFNHQPEQKFGPILWTMYTLNDSRSDEGFVMKLSVLTGPMGKDDNQTIELQIENEGAWQSLGFAKLDPDAWTATFRIANWNEKKEIKYRAIYREKLKNGEQKPDIYDGIIKSNPVGRKLKLAALTCQNDYAYPYAPVAENVEKMNPDLVFFSGDQIYESHGGFGVIRKPAQPAILNYLRMYYQFGWAFRDVMRNAPTVCLPDDHDVMQGNLWGENGAQMSDEGLASGRSDAWGGYIQPVRMINTVHKTHTSHMPEPYDKEASKRGISVYYCDMVYGDVGFAILADRQWKSGPDQLNIEVGVSGQGEDPGYINPAYDRADLQLLGARQEAFLEQWGKDFRGHKMKAVLSQTVLASICTHQPRPDRYLKYDFDSNGWPATARNKAVEIMRQTKALHICGDTHLPTLSQYGLHEQRDSNWAFCGPAIAVGWPRFWLPDVVGLPIVNRPEHALPQTGEYLDSFGNKMYIYAAGIPEVGKAANRYIKAHQKGSGFGFVTFDTQAKTYKIEAYKFLIDVTDGDPNNQFAGWPVVIHQDENIGQNKLS
ncbi:alkaline phosphatase D family protein [Catenovulum sediminis]|uniref:alkaline phosphatase D family protein n=1 Tax=Catenovulum sediminis TaxID=1740262 RepID=UPI00117D29BB|nr:alkaline phosphatase D family protein [Catenovulum sediminis]